MNTKSILTMPVLTVEDQYKVEKLEIQCPRGVLQLINKANDKRFIEEDVEGLKLWCNLVGRAHLIIKYACNHNV